MTKPEIDAMPDKGLTRAHRATSFVSADFGEPSGHEEEWRFTPIRRMRPLFDAAGYTGTTTTVVDAPHEVEVTQVARLGNEEPVVGEPADYPAALAWENHRETTTVTIPQGVEVGEPIYVEVGVPTKLSASRLVVDAQPLSKATVVVKHEGDVKFNETVEVRAQDGANLTVLTVYDWGPETLHAASHRVEVGRDSTLRHMVVTLAGDLVRVTVDSQFAGPGANLHLDGLYFVDAGEHIEQRVFMNHTEPDAYTRSTYKGALQGDSAQAVWVGDCLIGDGADNTDTYELNRNLLLTEGASVHSVPNLEIEDGDIEGAGHASAIGRFDDEQLFYLMSRGIPELEARRLVVRGFFSEVLNKVGVPDLQNKILDKIERLLEKYVAETVTKES